MLKPPKCNNKLSKVNMGVIGFVVIIIVIIGSTYAYQQGFQNGRYSHLTTKGYITPIVDGQITYEEWNRASLYMYPQWIRFDNTTLANNDWNFLLVGQDEYSLHIGLDMLSLTQPLPLETLEIYLVFNGEYFTTFSQYMILQDWGVEALIYDVVNNTIMSEDEKNTIVDASVQIGFHDSPNSSEIHRNVEISIPKSEMRYFDDNGEIGILVIGRYDGGIYYFAAASPNTEVLYYDSATYIGVNLGEDEEIFV